MSYSIQRLQLLNFRGYADVDLADFGDLVVFAGQNATGKTNLIESIQLLTAADSFRNPTNKELILWGEEEARIVATFVDGKRSCEHALSIQPGGRHYEINGKRKPAAEIRGTIPSVLFIPNDLQMIKSSSSARRDALDAIGTQLSAGYGNLKQEYAAALRQRNSLIKREITDGGLFDSWTDSLCVNGARLMLNRIKLFNRLKHHIEEIHPRLADGESLSVCYLPSWQLFDDTGHQGGSREIGDIGDIETAELPETVDEIEEILAAEAARLHGAEVQRAQTLVGPHKDELIFFLNGKNARLYASQGQQRTIVLAWKLAEVELVREILDRAPILLLDDVMSELDTARRGMLVQFIRQSTQTFITATDTDCISSALLERSQVIRLPLEQGRTGKGQPTVDVSSKAAG